MHGCPVDKHFAGGRSIDSGDQVKQRCLAASRLADDGDARSAWKLQLDVVERCEISAGDRVGLADVSKFDAVDMVLSIGHDVHDLACLRPEASGGVMPDKAAHFSRKFARWG